VALPVVFSIAVGLGAASGFGSPKPAYGMACGTLGPGGYAAPTDGCEPPLMVEGPVVVNLQGQTIDCHSDPRALSGTGIVVTGVRAHIRNGTVKDCKTGVLVQGDGGHRLRWLTVTASQNASGGDQGFVVESDGNLLVRNTVHDFPGEGYRVSGNANVLWRNRATDDGNTGFQIRPGSNNKLVGNQSKRNAGDGFRSRDGGNNDIWRNIAYRNQDAGIQLRNSAGNRVVGNILEHNGLDPCLGEDMDAGIAIRGKSDNQIKGNRSKGNCLGIRIEGDSTNNRVVHNVSVRNKEFDMQDDSKDCDDNVWRRNIFESSVAGPEDNRDESPPCIR
jgi:parallel beta-helix repeat protein